MSTTDTPGPQHHGEYDLLALINHLGTRDKLEPWQIHAGIRFGVIPPATADPADPEGAGRVWPAAVVDAVDPAAVLAAVGTDHPVGIQRAAEHLAQATGLPVQPSDITALTDAGVLTVAATFTPKPRKRQACVTYELWAPHQLHQVAVHQRDRVADTVEHRREWIAAGVTRDEAAALLGWRWTEVRDVAEQRGILYRHGRYLRDDIDALAADLALCDQVDRDRLIGPDQSAQRLRIRRTDWDYLVGGGLIAPQTNTWKPVGRSSEVKVPMYLTAEVDQLPARVGPVWADVLACQPGDPSPLRYLVDGRPRTRGELVRRFIAEAGDRYQVDMWAHYQPRGAFWEINWAAGDTAPTTAQVTELLCDNPLLAKHRRHIHLDTGTGAVTRWARAMLEPGAAVILDTETTDLYGRIIEVAVIDACTGRVLLDTLVDPEDTPIAPSAFAVHGITAAMLEGAPVWDRVLPRLRKATKDRQILAYNADYDQRVILSDTMRAGRRPLHLAEDGRWGCIMGRRSDWLGTSRRLRLGGAHRAVGDCRTAREVLIEIAGLGRG